ncbi:MAG: hypothetical protein GX438_12290 [Treponema sp.]|nr:hypothetical protein [Treponema sp.]
MQTVKGRDTGKRPTYLSRAALSEKCLETRFESPDLVGLASGANPLRLIILCHRHLAAGGRLGPHPHWIARSIMVRTSCCSRVSRVCPGEK